MTPLGARAAAMVDRDYAGPRPDPFRRTPRTTHIASAVLWCLGDTLWAYDSEAGRITLFDRAGNVLSTGPTHGLQIPLASGFGYVLPERMRPDGLFTGWLSRISYSRDDPPSGFDESVPVPIPHVLFDATGAVVDTIGWMPAPPPRMVPPPDFDNGPPVRITVGSQSYFVPRAPPELPRWLPLVDGRIVVDVPNATDASAGRFTVTRIGLNSDAVYHRVL
ncbi:MAG TPA: hypothetical protein VHG09_01955, partial [Longimicrobiales bacterium]|nr:hypothetical protein [Longimicrobiales bacterium]